MTHETTTLLGAISLLIAALAYFIRYLFEQMSKQLQVLSEQRAECRETLVTRFADKVETQYAIGRLMDKTEALDNRVSLIEGSIRRQ